MCPIVSRSVSFKDSRSPRCFNEQDFWAVDIRRFPDPPDPEVTLQCFAALFQLELGLGKAQQELILRRVSLLAGLGCLQKLCDAFLSWQGPSEHVTSNA